jgi:phage baseplate assembly protein W
VGIDQIKSDILALLLTNQGERVMLPNFGADLRRFLFEPADAIVAEEIRGLIADQLRLWEPRVVIEDIDIIVDPDKSDLSGQDDLTEKASILLIRINFFDPENIDEVQELKLEVPLPGG